MPKQLWQTGKPPSANMIFRNLKKYRTQDQPAVNFPELEKTDHFLTGIGPKLALSIPPAQYKYEIDKPEKSMVVNYTYTNDWKFLT